MARAVLDAPETIPAGHGRYFLTCSGTPHSGWAHNGQYPAVPCAPRWETLPETRTRVSEGYGRYWTIVKPTIDAKCPCGSWYGTPVRLQVDAYFGEDRKRHTCENTCQWSESKKCRCACGGRRHGEALREICFY